jgi:hypothetical protein
VETNRYTVKVTSLTAARAVDTTDFDGKATKIKTGFLFLIVDVSVTTPREPMKLSTLGPPLLLAGNGRSYQPTDKVNQNLTLFSKQFQPGLWSRGVLVYEVPLSAVPGARFVFVPPVGFIVDNSAPEAEIDLGLTDAAAARLISRAEAYHSLVAKS